MSNMPRHRTEPSNKLSRAAFIKAHPDATPEELIELGKKSGLELDRGRISRVRWVVRANAAASAKKKGAKKKGAKKKGAKKKPAKRAAKKTASAKRVVRAPLFHKQAVIGETVVTYDPNAITAKFPNIRKDKRVAQALAEGVDLNDTPERIAARVLGDALNTLVVATVKKEFRRILAESANS